MVHKVSIQGNVIIIGNIYIINIVKNAILVNNVNLYFVVLLIKIFD